MYKIVIFSKNVISHTTTDSQDGLHFPHDNGAQWAEPSSAQHRVDGSLQLALQGPQDEGRSPRLPAW